MPRSAAVCAAVALLSLVLVAPAQAEEIENYWDGVWLSDHEGTKLMKLNLDQKNGSREVTGGYRHPKEENGDKGKVFAEAKGKFGKRLVGTYKSNGDGGRGGFEIKLKPDLASWNGEFWPCRYRIYCSVFDWTGSKPGFE